MTWKVKRFLLIVHVSLVGKLLKGTQNQIDAFTNPDGFNWTATAASVSMTAAAAASVSVTTAAAASLDANNFDDFFLAAATSPMTSMTSMATVIATASDFFLDLDHLIK